MQAWETRYQVRTRANLLWGGMLYRSSRSSCRLKVFHIAGIDFLSLVLRDSRVKCTWWRSLNVTKNMHEQEENFPPCTPLLKGFFIWGRYWWMPKLKPMPKWRTVREHIGKLLMHMQTWIYGKKLRNSWVIHYRRNIYRWLQVLWTFGPNLKTIMMMRKTFFVL